jgi:integrase
MKFVANRLKAWRALEGNTSELVFANNAGNVEFHTTMVGRMLNPLQIKAGVTKLDASGKPVPKYTGTHVLRHFFASWCINRTVDGGLELPLKTVQARLGHATLSMTADVYGHLFPSTDDHSELAAAEKALGLHVA